MRARACLRVKRYKDLNSDKCGTKLDSWPASFLFCGLQYLNMNIKPSRHGPLFSLISGMGWNDFKMMFLVCLFPAAGPAFAQQPSDQIRIPNIPQFKPVLTVNEQPDICAAYKTAWEEVYAGDTGLNETHTDLHAAFPEAVHVFPKNPKAAGRGYYGDSIEITFDDDGDGEDEILYLKGDHSSWRSTGVRIFYYDDHKDFEADVTPEGQADKRTPRSRHGFGNTANTKARILVDYPRLSSAHIFKMDGKLYSEANVTYQSGVPQSASLDWVRPGEDPVSICKVKLSPQVSTLDSVAAGQTYARLLDIYGGPETGGMCYGTMGWTAKPVFSHLPDLFYRPQAMKALHDRKIDMSAEEDAAREFRYIAWGLSDPSSFNVVESLKKTYPGFIAEFSLYYQLMLGMEAADAQAAAELGYRYLLDRVFYARSNGTGIGFLGIDVGPSTPLPKIASLAVDKAISDKNGDLQVLKLGLMTGLSAERLTQLLDLLLSDDNPNYRYSELDEAVKNDLKLRYINELFLSSLQNPEIMTLLLNKGAEIDAPTNYFAKTALMYAAQNNDLEVTKRLLLKGANLNSKTKSDGKLCQSPLKRDARTALMYAAENAETALILALINAGADILAQDSLGNTALWYLGRNTYLSEIQNANLIPNLTPQ